MRASATAFLRAAGVALLAVSLIATLSQCSRRGASSSLTRVESRGSVALAEEGEVYAAVIDSLFRRPSVRRLLVADRTLDLSSQVARGSWPLKRPSALHTSAFADFRAKNSAVQRLAVEPPSRLTVARLGDRESRSLASGGQAAWREFVARHPDVSGVLELSRVGFRDDGLQAFVIVRSICGARCREEVAVVAGRYPNGQWRVRERHVLAPRSDPSSRTPARGTAAPARRGAGARNP